ncbi:DUF742 domain-containing protein [Streptomyces niveus]|uniref:DUF742 domain-containing protein n=1 Tax=Streptomyces niveus TaxID=193462 RepID=UPI00366311A0
MSPSRRRGGRLVPAYLAAGDGPEPADTPLDRLTLLKATGPAEPAGLAPAQQRLVLLVNGGEITLDEAAAHLALPVSVVRLLVSQLLDGGHLTAGAPIPPAELHGRSFLERVLRGLKAAG